MPEQEEQPGQNNNVSHSRIPTFSTIEEEAAFWDTHSFEEFADELESVTDVKFVRARHTRAITVRLEAETFEELQRQAREKGVGPSTLTRMWILERLHTTPTKKSAAS